jgi:teichuronic acid biosynthesis glycosyltransferase TuaC
LNILVLTKRQYTNKDLLDDHYGRLWEIPLCLFKKGHNIKGVCLSYRKSNRDKYSLSENNRNLEWVSLNFLSLPFNCICYLKCQFNLFKPDVIWASSDCFHVLLGYILGKIYRIPCILDLYDNYEAFKLSKFTGIIPIYRLVLKNADAVSIISKPLLYLVKKNYKAKGTLTVIENAVDTEIFYPRNKNTSRKTFNLPENAKIIGTAGALDESRGIDSLYTAFVNLSKEIVDLYLVVAGSGSRKHPIFKHPNIRDFGVLPNKDVAFLLSALDVAIICNKKSEFSRYCFPQKAYEILASETPLISANVGAMSLLLKDNPECLFNPLEPHDLANKIASQLQMPTKLAVPINTWCKQSELLENLMKITIATYGQ